MIARRLEWVHGSPGTVAHALDPAVFGRRTLCGTPLGFGLLTPAWRQARRCARCANKGAQL